MQGSAPKQRPNRRNRLDELLLDRGLAETLPSARSLILAGQVVVNEQRVDKPGTLCNPCAHIRLKNTREFVSRGGLKLKSAMTAFGITDQFRGTLVVDLGASTGGFTDCLLQAGTARVLSVEIGSNQLSWKLRKDPRVVSVEKTDLRNFSPTRYGTPDWIVADLSFIRLSLVAGHIGRMASPGTGILLLVKPQFELPAEQVPPGGVVRNPELRNKAFLAAKNALELADFQFMASCDAAIRGRSGNLEIFLYMIKSPENPTTPEILQPSFRRG